MSEFQTYLTLGFYHILDWQGYDHMVFLLALIAPIAVKDWKKILILITAFTIGHSIALAASTLQFVVISTAVVEFLIPVTILFTCFVNVMMPKHLRKSHFIIILFFGLIHGLGFSGYLKALLGEEESILWPLMSFNLGLEFGQIIFTVVVVAIISILTIYLSVKQRTINLLLSFIAGVVAIFLISGRI